MSPRWTRSSPGTPVDRELKTAALAGGRPRPDELLAALAPRVGPERLLDLMLRAGPYGDGFGARPAGGLSLAELEEAPHGVDLGPLAPRLPDALRTPSGMIELAPAPIVADVPAPGGNAGRARPATGRCWSAAASCAPTTPGCTTCRCWCGEPSACTLHVHPDDAERYGLTDGGAAELRTRTGAVTAEVEVTDEVMPGVVSLPHGWGHDADRGAADGRRRPRRRQLQRARRRAAGRRRLRQRGAQRDPGDTGPGGRGAPENAAASAR